MALEINEIENKSDISVFDHKKTKVRFSPNSGEIEIVQENDLPFEKDNWKLPKETV